MLDQIFPDVLLLDDVQEVLEVSLGPATPSVA